MADTFEEAIRSLSAEDAETRPVCIIDNDLRTITMPSNFILGVYNDKDVHEILFSMPRYYNDIDLSGYSIRVNYINAAGTENDYYVETKDVLDDTIKFSWLTSRMVFSYAGEVRFSVCLRNTDEEGVVTNEFNTTIASGTVLEGIEVDDHQEDPEISDLIVKITKAKDDAEAAAEQSEENVTHYPKIENGKWIVYDAKNDAWVDTGIAAQGPKGDTGETGAKGDTGKTPDFHIGAVYNVPYGQSATASITGTPERPILSLAIPEGARGAKGDTGDTGATGPKGDTGAIGTPLVASTASEMTDTTRLYIYTGSESGYSNGHWYHYDGTAWVDGGLYNAVAFQTDKTLSVEGMAADSAATGEAIDDLKADLNGSVTDLKSAFEDTNAIIDYSVLRYVEASTATAGSNLYRKISELSAEKKYAFKVTVETTGTYNLHTSTGTSVSTIVDEITNQYSFNAGETVWFYNYTPTVSGIGYLRLSNNVAWSANVYEIPQLASDVETLTDSVLNAQNDIGDIQRGLEDTNNYIESFTKTQGPLQLFDCYHCDVYHGIYQGASNTFASLGRGAIIIACEINGLAGETYTYNCISDDSYATMGIEKVEILASNNAIPVAGESYLQTGSSNQTAKRGTITLGQNTRYLLFSVIIPSGLARDFDFSTLLSNIVVRKGAYDTTYYPYRLLNVTEPDLSEEIRNKLNQTGDVNAYRQILTQSLHVGTSVLTDQSVSLGTGWSGTISNGFAHAGGSADPLSFNVATENNSSYLVSFTLSNIAEKSVYVKIGNSASVDVYNGTTDINVGIVADGGYLTIVPASAWGGTITNLKLRKVGETGDEIVLEVKNVDTKVNDSSLTGFWNVILGVDNFGKNQNGSRNISVGYASLSKLESGTRNICIGTFSMPYVKDGDRNIAIGADSLYSTRNHSHAHAEDCVAIGYRAMSDGTNIKYNVAIGTNAMKESTDTATYNVCVGAGAGMFANYGLIAIGYNACAKSYTKADASVFVGRNSGVDNTGATAQTPKNVSNVIAIGDGVLVKTTNEARFGNASNVIYLAGKRIVFNDDHTVTWEEDT